MSKKYKLNIISIISLVMAAKPLLVIAADEENKQPSMAFLEYLADQVEVDGKLVGPMDLQSDEKTIAKKVNEKTITQLPAKNAQTNSKTILPNAVSYSETTEDNNHD